MIVHCKKTCLLFICCIAGLLPSIHAQVFYAGKKPLVSKKTIRVFVSAQGNDKNVGSFEKPLKTIGKALQNVTAYQNKNVLLFIRSGKYYLDTTLILDQQHIKVNSLTISAYKNEQVTISAGRLLQLKWLPWRNGIYKANIPAGISFERLFINCQLQVLARYPNYDSAARVFHGTAADAIAPARIKTWKNPVDAYVHALHAAEWGGLHYRITGVDENGEAILEGGWQNNRPSGMHTEYRFVENVFEELDAPNEWYLDKKEHTLYYFPSKGLALDNALVEVANLAISIALKGTAQHPVKNIELKNLQFVHNERTFWETKEPLLRSDWTIYRGAAVLFDGTENCKISDCNFTGLGGNAIMLSNYNKSDTISGNHIYNIGASAICLIGDARAVRSPSFKYEDFVAYKKMDTTPGPATDNYPQHCVVSNNLLHNLGDIEKQATGVEIEIASGITVSHNSIYHTPRAGINIGDGCFGGHIIEYNDVFNTVLETGDHGSFNSWGRDRFWAADRNYMDSLVTVHPELILLDAVKQTTIRNNRFRCDHGWDIDLDDGSGNYHIYNNVCLNGGLKLREGFYRIVENNVIVNNSFHPHVWFRNSSDVFKHNIIMKRYAPIQISDWGTNINDNLFPDDIALKDAQQNGTDSLSKAGNPIFINAAAGNYQVASNSPALTIGFKNFVMDQFGVQKPALKKIALTPVIPVLSTNLSTGDKSVVADFLGGKIKSVDGPGDRAAYGLPDETGVVVLAAGNGLLKKSGVKDNDVIRIANGHEIKTTKDLLDIYQANSWKPTITVEAFRNQQPVKIVVLLK